MTEHFPDAEIMICGGHAGKAHKKQLEKLAKMKSFTDKFKNKHNERLPQVDSVVCHCEKWHKPGYGCQKHLRKHKTIFNLSSQTVNLHEFAEALKALPRHACDKQEGNARFMH